MFRAAALALALFLPFAAQAADVATINCVDQSMDKATRALILTDLEVNLDNAGGAQSYRPETVTAVQNVAKSCQAKYGWSDAATEASILYTVPKIGWPTAVRKARAKGLDPDALRARFNTLSEADRNDAVNERVLGILARGSDTAKEINQSNAALGGALYGLLGLEANSLYKFRNN
jgi:hypothetical protein